ncbi:hypothetical protein J6590_029733 [Homalodisca vitripennis]|nr:hypothetical protein J6590_029733 [Homalodisca vitripennis]
MSVTLARVNQLFRSASAHCEIYPSTATGLAQPGPAHYGFYGLPPRIARRTRPLQPPGPAWPGSLWLFLFASAHCEMYPPTATGVAQPGPAHYGFSCLPPRIARCTHPLRPARPSLARLTMALPVCLRALRDVPAHCNRRGPAWPSSLWLFLSASAHCKITPPHSDRPGPTWPGSLWLYQSASAHCEMYPPTATGLAQPGQPFNVNAVLSKSATNLWVGKGNLAEGVSPQVTIISPPFRAFFKNRKLPPPLYMTSSLLLIVASARGARTACNLSACICYGFWLGTGPTRTPFDKMLSHTRDPMTGRFKLLEVAFREQDLQERNRNNLASLFLDVELYDASDIEIQRETLRHVTFPSDKSLYRSTYLRPAHLPSSAQPSASDPSVSHRYPAHFTL